jgi:hypothetical protein
MDISSSDSRLDRSPASGSSIGVGELTLNSFI